MFDNRKAMELQNLRCVEHFEKLTIPQMMERRKLIELLESAESAVYWDSSDKGFIKKIADHLIANGITFATDNNVGSKWIPVTEQLPKYFGTFLVAIEEVHGEKRISVDAADFDPFEKKWATFGYFCAGFTITHWMPLPEPPKEGSDG